MLPLLISISFVGVLKSLLLFFFVLSSLLLILVVLLQEPKGGGLAAAFGGAGAETFGVQSGTVNKFTTYVGGTFIVLAILYAMIRPGADDDSTLSDHVPAVTAPASPGGAGNDSGGGDGGGDDSGTGGG